MQEKAVTGLYSTIRRTGLLEKRLGQNVFVNVYFQYKKHFEDPFEALVRQRPELFRNGHILDIGANVGYTAAVFARALQDGYKIFAFEPELFNFKLLENTAAKRRLKDCIIPIQSAVGEESGIVELCLNDHHHADHRVVTDHSRVGLQNRRTALVAMTSVDMFVHNLSFPGDISFIKIDVQGFEFAVCLGMERTLAANQEVTVALEYMPAAMQDLGFDSSALLTWFENRDFKAYSLTRDGQLQSGVDENMARRAYLDLVFSRRSLE